MTMLTGLPCRADVMSLGTASGAPGDQVSLLLSIAPDEQVTNFDCVIEYDVNLLALDSASLSDDAAGNSINGIWCDESPPGRVHIYTASDSSWWIYDISELATLEFTISSTAASNNTQVKFIGSAYYKTDQWNTATTKDGSITISVPTPAPPAGNRPELSLRMESAMVLTYGGEPVVSYNVGENDWKGYRADAYLAVSLPNGTLLYRDSHGRLTSKQTPVVGNMTIADSSGNISFGTLPSTAPPGLYTIYSVLATVSKNPLTEAYRISNVEDTQFQLVASTSTSNP